MRGLLLKPEERGILEFRLPSTALPVSGSKGMISGFIQATPVSKGIKYPVNKWIANNNLNYFQGLPVLKNSALNLDGENPVTSLKRRLKWYWSL